MKSVVVWGCMGADRTSDQYPTVNICDDCYSAEKNLEESRIVNLVGEYDPDNGDECHFCGASLNED